MTHILHMAEDTAGEKDYFLTLRYADPRLTSAEVREGSLQWTPSAKTLAIIGLPPIRKVVGEQRQCQTKGRTRVFGLTCFLIKSRGQTTPSNLDFGDSSVLSEMHYQNILRLGYFHQLYLKIVLHLLPWLDYPVWKKKTSFGQVNNRVGNGGHFNLRPQIFQQTIGGWGSTQTQPNRQAASVSVMDACFSSPGAAQRTWMLTLPPTAHTLLGKHMIFVPSWQTSEVSHRRPLSSRPL